MLHRRVPAALLRATPLTRGPGIAKAQPEGMPTSEARGASAPHAEPARPLPCALSCEARNQP